jgi:zinc protease
LGAGGRAFKSPRPDHTLYLLLNTDRKAPIVHLNLRFQVGSKHEKPGQHGLAHPFEHLIYQGRGGIPISTVAEPMGATTLSGTTQEDFTTVQGKGGGP